MKLVLDHSVIESLEIIDYLGSNYFVYSTTSDVKPFIVARFLKKFAIFVFTTFFISFTIGIYPILRDVGLT